MGLIRRRGGRGLALATVVAGVLAALTGCTTERPGPQDAAEALASAIESGTFADVSFTSAEDAATAEVQREAAYAGLEPRVPDVTVATTQVDEDEPDLATATLDLTWDLGTDQPWSYSTEAHLERGGDSEDEDAWQVAWSPALLAPELTAGETLALGREQAPRAPVLGAGGAEIVVDRPVHRIGIDKTLGEPAQQDADARALATALGMDPEAYAAQVAAAGERAFVQAIVVREGDPGYDVPALTTLPTARAVDDVLPLAPTRTFARPVLGTAGEATAEIVEESGGAIAPGDVTGLSGLQRQYDEQLRGTPGLVVRAVSADGSAERELYRVDAVPGTPLQTTLDVDLQTAAESVLAGVGPASALVAVRPSTGDVVAVASGPGGGGLSTATLGQYPPGSTFKVASALALLRSGMTADTEMSCPPSITVEGRQFENFPGYPEAALGPVPLRTAFAHSCNTAFIAARDEAPAQALAEAAGSLGLTTAEGLGFPAFLGSVPTESAGTDHAAAMIGQGRVLASPLGMAVVAASVAHGSMVVPQLVVAPPAGAGTAETATEPTSPAAESPAAGSPAESSAAESPAPSASTPATPLTTDEASTLLELMRGVVTEGGATFLQDVPGPGVAAKTGTAQFGQGEDLQNHAWMIAVQDDLAVAVFVEVGEFGSTTAGPLLEEFLSVVNGA